MTQTKFFSCVESQIQTNGEMYSRFHMGTFFRGQALTLANALRRTLLAEIPSVVVTGVKIEGINNEFANLPGVKETVLDILLNIKNLVFTFSSSDSNLLKINDFKAQAFLKIQGPALITAADIKLPANVKCINPDFHIATLSCNSELSICLELQFVNPTELLVSKSDNVPSLLNENNFFQLNTIPSPVRKVNYIIHNIDTKIGSEYIAFEIWTDGSLSPAHILQYAFKQLTKMFYGFSDLSKQ